VELRSLGYICVGSSRLDDWSAFACDLMGMQRVDQGPSMRAFRMDDRKQRLVLQANLPEGESIFGWEVEASGDLDRVGQPFGVIVTGRDWTTGLLGFCVT